MHKKTLYFFYIKLSDYATRKLFARDFAFDFRNMYYLEVRLVVFVYKIWANWTYWKRKALNFKSYFFRKSKFAAIQLLSTVFELCSNVDDPVVHAVKLRLWCQPRPDSIIVKILEKNETFLIWKIEYENKRIFTININYDWKKNNWKRFWNQQLWYLQF